MKHGLRKLSLVLIILSVCLTPVFAGGQQETKQAEAEGPVVLTLLVDNQSNVAGIEAVSKAAEEKFGIRTEIELRPGGAEGDNLLKTRLMAEEMTDLSFYNSGSLFLALNPQQFFVDLSDEAFMQNVTDSFKETVSVDGRAYAIPADTAMAGGWFYNKRVYAELGLEVPETWAELMANCEAIEAAGTQSVIATYKDSWTAQLLVLADYYNIYAEYPEFADDYTNNIAKFASSDIARRGFEKLADVYDRGFIGNEPISTGYEDGLSMLLNGEGAHYPMLAFILPTLSTIDPEKAQDIGFFPQPGDSADDFGMTLWMPAGIAIYNGSDHIEEAKTWMEFMLSPEGMGIYMEASPPSGPYMIKGTELPEDTYPSVQQMLPFINGGKTAPALEFLSPIKGPNLPQICVEVGIGISTPLEAAQTYDKDVEKQAKQLGLENW